MSVSNTALGIDPIPAWMVAPSGMRSATNDGDAPVDLVGRDGRDLDERIVGLGPADGLADVELVAPERARHLRVRLEEERDCPMNAAT